MDFINNTIARFKSAGLKITPQRLAICKLLDGNKNHPTAEDIFAKLKNDYPHISFTTVYNILRTMVRMGVAKELVIDRDRVHYDPDTSSHHHALCTHCGKIYDVMLPHFIPQLPKEVASVFKTESCQINFYGTCNHCKKKQTER